MGMGKAIEKRRRHPPSPRRRRASRYEAVEKEKDRLNL
jgi:hypothetical protein